MSRNNNYLVFGKEYKYPVDITDELVRFDLNKLDLNKDGKISGWKEINIKSKYDPNSIIFINEFDKNRDVQLDDSELLELSQYVRSQTALTYMNPDDVKGINRKISGMSKPKTDSSKNLYRLMYYLVDVKGVTTYVNLEYDRSGREKKVFDDVCAMRYGPNNECKYVDISVVDMTPHKVEHFIQFFELLDKTKDKEGRMMIHCTAGWGRSGITLMSYFWYKNPQLNIRDVGELMLNNYDIRGFIEIFNKCIKPWHRGISMRFYEHLLGERLWNMKTALKQHANIDIDLEITRKYSIRFNQYVYDYGERDKRDIEYLKDISYKHVQEEEGVKQMGGCLNQTNSGSFDIKIYSFILLLIVILFIIVLIRRYIFEIEN